MPRGLLLRSKLNIICIKEIGRVAGVVAQLLNYHLNQETPLGCSVVIVTKTKKVTVLVHKDKAKTVHVFPVIGNVVDVAKQSHPYPLNLAIRPT